MLVFDVPFIHLLSMPSLSSQVLRKGAPFFIVELAVLLRGDDRYFIIKSSILINSNPTLTV